MTDTDADALPRLRAKRAANKGVVTKLIEESDAILENDVELMDLKTRNRNKDKWGAAGKATTHQRA